MKKSGGNRASGGASLGTRLVVLGALGYAVVYFFDRSLGEERRRRVVVAAQTAVHELVQLSQRLVAAPPADDGAAVPEPDAVPQAAPPEPVIEPVRAYHEQAPEPDIAETLHDKVTFFRLGDETADEEAVPVLAPVAVIAEELPADPPQHERAYDPPSSPPTIIAYDADPAPEPELEADEPVPTSHARSGRTLLAIAAVVAVLAAAAALGGWAIFSGDSGTQDALPASPGAAQLVSLMSQPGAHPTPVAGSKGTMVLVTTPSGRAVLVISNLKRAPGGKIYQAWIVRGKTPISAGLFKGGQPKYVIPLSQRVPKGAIFAVTVERAGGVPAPTHKPAYAVKID
jgi:hypothetical protein